MNLTRAPTLWLVQNYWRALGRVGYSDSAAGEAVGTSRANLRCIAVGEGLSLTSQRTTSESAGVAGALRPFRSLWFGDGDTAAGKPIRTGRANRRRTKVRKRLGLSLQRTAGESAGMAQGLRIFRSVRIRNRYTAAGKAIGTGRADWGSFPVGQGMDLPLQRSPPELAGMACHFGSCRRLADSDTAAGKTVGAGRANLIRAAIRECVSLSLQWAAGEFAGMAHLASSKGGAQQ
jgi:hypothetical protein